MKRDSDSSGSVIAKVARSGLISGDSRTLIYVSLIDGDKRTAMVFRTLRRSMRREVHDGGSCIIQEQT